VAPLGSAQGAFYGRVDDDTVHPWVIGGCLEQKPLMLAPVPAELEPPGRDHAVGVASLRVPNISAPGRVDKAEPDIHVHTVLVATVHGRHASSAWLRKVAHHHQRMSALAQCPTQLLHQANRIRVAVIAVAMTPNADEADACGRQRPRARDAAVRRAPDNGGRSRSHCVDLCPGKGLRHGHDAQTNDKTESGADPPNETAGIHKQNISFLCFSLYSVFGCTPGRYTPGSLNLQITHFYLTARARRSQLLINDAGPSRITAGASIHINRNGTWRRWDNCRALAGTLGIGERELINRLTGREGYTTWYMHLAAREMRRTIEHTVGINAGATGIDWTGSDVTFS